MKEPPSDSGIRYPLLGEPDSSFPRLRWHLLPLQRSLVSCRLTLRDGHV